MSAKDKSKPFLTAPFDISEAVAKAEAKHAATGSERRSNTDYQYWFERDWDTDNPIALLRYRGGYMTTWNSKEQEWRPSVRSVPELEGLGGSADFRSIDAESAGRVKEYLDRARGV